MVDLTAIQGAITGLQTATNIVKAFITIRDNVKLQEQAFELQRIILEVLDSALNAKVSQSAMLDDIRDLKEKVAHLEAWGAEKQSYELQLRSSTGVLAYRIKEAMRGTGPDHWLCAACYDSGRKAVLQYQPGPHRDTEISCPVCRFKVLAIGLVPDGGPPIRRSHLN